ncbi:hypothetical protein F5Y11DRAFT_347378 [Daldinia sp. FL1419]|nr:hypothetical protein F5Y11DRAFT_347378 [Daldinia sp. FL1419]
MTDCQSEDNRPPWARISFPSGWNSERFSNLTLDDFRQVPEEERKRLKECIRKFPFSKEYTKLSDLNKALREENERPPTPPAYVPSGWTVDQARGLSLGHVIKLSEDEQRLWAAGQTAESARRAHKRGQLPTKPPSYIPGGWSAEQAIFPTFELLSQLSHQDLARFMESRNEANQASSPNIPPPPAQQAPSQLVQVLQREDFPPWGFSILQSYNYESDRIDQIFRDRCTDGFTQELEDVAGKSFNEVNNTFDLKWIDDAPIRGASVEEVRNYFNRIEPESERTAFLMADQGSFDSIMADDGGVYKAPYILVVDATEFDREGGYKGYFKASLDAVASDLYPKMHMELSLREIWATMDDADGIWLGD